MKKDDRSEKLSEWLSQTDDDLLNEAYLIDSADQLKKRAEGEKTVRKTVYIRKYAVRRLVAAALCLLVVAGVLLTVPALFKTDEPLVTPPITYGTAGGGGSRQEESAQGTPSAASSQPNSTGNDNPSRAEESLPTSQPDATESSEPPQSHESSQGTQSEPPSQPGGDLPNVVLPTEGLHIESIDMLNYYSAIRILASSSGNALSNLSAGRGSSRGIKLLAAGEDMSLDVTTAPPPDPEESIQSPEQSDPPAPPEIYYYELDPDAVFYIEKVSFFQIMLTDETSFLASKIGTGVVDVVITESPFEYYNEPMITFKNGDRYYSCLGDGYVAFFDEAGNPLGHNSTFSAHKYIEGFYIVKNFALEIHTFSVSFEGDQVTSFMCSDEHPDGPSPVVSKTYVSNQLIGYTIAELEEYFNFGG